MEFHAHLSCYEVIGLLGGHWDAAARRIAVMEAFPCRRAAGEGLEARRSLPSDGA
jgi:protein MYSM1